MVVVGTAAVGSVSKAEAVRVGLVLVEVAVVLEAVAAKAVVGVDLVVHWKAVAAMIVALRVVVHVLAAMAVVNVVAVLEVAVAAKAVSVPEFGQVQCPVQSVSAAFAAEASGLHVTLLTAKTSQSASQPAY